MTTGIPEKAVKTKRLGRNLEVVIDEELLNKLKEEVEKWKGNLSSLPILA